MPIGITDEESVQANEDYPYLPVEADTEEVLKENISHRIMVDNEIKTLQGVKKMIDGTIHGIVNNHIYKNESAQTIKNGYMIEGPDGEQVQVQVRNSYTAKKCKIKRKKGGPSKETNEDILSLAEIFELDRNEDGTFPFPEGTFAYRDMIKIDPKKVHPDMFEEFIKDVRELGQKYKQGRLNPVSESTELVDSGIGTSRFNLTFEQNLDLHAVFQNLAIKLINEDEDEDDSI